MLHPPQCLSPIIGINQALAAAYPPENHFSDVISDIQQQAVLHRIDEEIQREHFYFSISLKENRIIDCKGVTCWLGYRELNFSLQKLDQIIHPAHAAMEPIYGMALLQLIKNQEIKLQFLQPLFSTLLAIKHTSGKYMYCKRECLPFQLSETNKLTAYLFLFTIIKEFNQEPYHTRLYLNNEANSEIADNLSSLVKKCFLEHTDFSTQELRILKRYAQKKETTTSHISAAFKIKKATVNTYNKRIMRKAEQFSQQKFTSAKEVAKYYRLIGFI